MSLKILHWAGVAACILLIISCFIPWAYYGDIQQTFTGFYSYKNEYGRPGKFLVFIGVVTLVLMLLPKVWGKRVNLFLTALGVGYAIKTYVLYTSCYNAYCPEKRFGVYLMLISSVVMLAAAIFPNLSVVQKTESVAQKTEGAEPTG